MSYTIERGLGYPNSPDAGTLGDLAEEIVRARTKFPKNEGMLGALTEEIGELARVKSATPGPWSTRSDDIPVGVKGSRGPKSPTECRLVFCVPVCDEDAIFIAHAREDVPALISTVRGYESSIAALIKRYEDMREEHPARAEAYLWVLEDLRKLLPAERAAA